MIKHFVNLTNGIEAIPDIVGDINFIRIQSTTLENKNWYKFFIDIDHNLLMWLSLGAECRIYDFGTNRPKSKVIYYGLPVLEYCLNKYWFGIEQDTVWIGRNPTNQKQYVDVEIYSRYFQYHNEKLLDTKCQITSKYKYYRKFIGDLKKINIVGISSATSHDSDLDFYRQILGK